MPDLRDLLNDAVDRPAPLDMDDLGRRVARHQRHRRLATITAAAALMILVGAAAATLALRSNGPDVDIDPVPPATEGTLGTTTTAPPSSSTTGAGDLPACTADDVEIVPTGEGATAQQAIYLEVSAAAGGQPCSIDTSATITLRDISTDEVLDIGLFDNSTDQVLEGQGNPVAMTLSGAVGEGQPGVEQPSVVWSGCVPGAVSDDRGEATIEAVVDGLGTYRGTTLGPRCATPGSGSTISVTTGPLDPPD